MSPAGLEPAASALEERCRVPCGVGDRNRPSGPWSSGARTRTSIAGVKGQHPAVGRHLNKDAAQRPRRAVVPPVGLEPTHFRVRTGCSALELRRRLRGNHASLYADFSCHAPSAPCRWRFAMSVCSGNRRFTNAAVGCGSSGEGRTPIPRVRAWCPAIGRRSNMRANTRGPGETRTLTSRSKKPVRCRYATGPRKRQNAEEPAEVRPRAGSRVDQLRCAGYDSDFPRGSSSFCSEDSNAVPVCFGPGA